MDTPELYTKYLGMYTSSKLHLRKLEQDMRVLLRDKRDYYSGATDRKKLQDTGIKPFQRVLLKDAVETWVAADDEVGNLKLRISYQEELVDTLKRILDLLSNRRWEIKNAQEWLRFQSGG